MNRYIKKWRNEYINEWMNKYIYWQKTTITKQQKRGFMPESLGSPEGSFWILPSIYLGTPRYTEKAENVMINRKKRNARILQNLRIWSE